MGIFVMVYIQGGSSRRQRDLRMTLSLRNPQTAEGEGDFTCYPLGCYHILRGDTLVTETEASFGDGQPQEKHASAVLLSSTTPLVCVCLTLYVLPLRMLPHPEG